MKLNNSDQAVTAIVVSRNEGHNLHQCLSALHWCDELIVVNMESSDNTEQIASCYADIILNHQYSPIVEPVRCFAMTYAKSPWILFVDPDEYFNDSLALEIKRLVNNPHIGSARLPWRFYFKGRPLLGGIWGGVNKTKQFLVNKNRSTLSAFSQRGATPNSQYQEHTINHHNDNHVRHEWSVSYRHLLNKHIRLAWHDGPAQYALGKRFQLRDLCIKPATAGYDYIITRNGYKDGFQGLLLSMIYSAYVLIATVSLCKAQYMASRLPTKSKTDTCYDRKEAA